LIEPRTIYVKEEFKSDFTSFITVHNILSWELKKHIGLEIEQPYQLKYWSLDNTIFQHQPFKQKKERKINLQVSMSAKEPANGIDH
jgi:hypothetical protein